MDDNRSDKVKKICDNNINTEHSCDGCPLRQPCKPVRDDSKEAFDIRMNKAAEELGE